MILRPSLELGEGEKGAIGVGEPSDLIAVRGRPYAASVLLQALVVDEYGPRRFKSTDSLSVASTRQPSTVYPGRDTSATAVTHSIVPLASNTQSNGGSRPPLVGRADS